MHIVVAQPVSGECIEIRGVDRAAKTTQMAEAGIVENDEQDIGRALPRPIRRRPRGLRYIKGSADHARKA